MGWLNFVPSPVTTDQESWNLLQTQKPKIAAFFSLDVAFAFVPQEK
jgi:hypothetical protein